MLKKDFFLLVKSSLEAIEPSKLIRNVIRIDNRSLVVENQNAVNTVTKREFLLNHNLYVVAFGKAALGN
jgi:hypothetical protein